MAGHNRIKDNFYSQGEIFALGSRKVFHEGNVAGFLRSDQDDTFSGALVSSARNKGIFGTYDSRKTDQIWSMGLAYKNAADGSNFGNLYGLAYKHTNNATGGTMAGGHQMVWCTNGNPKAALGDSGIWTNGYVNGAYLGITNTSSTSMRGLSLHGGAKGGKPTYGVLFAGTANMGTHGGVTSDWATYFTMSDTSNRGWVFQRGSTNVASISGAGLLTLNGGLRTAAPSNFSTNTNTQHLMISRGGLDHTEVVKIGVDDTYVRFHYINDESNAGFQWRIQNTGLESGTPANDRSMELVSNEGGMTLKVGGGVESIAPQLNGAGIDLNNYVKTGSYNIYNANLMTNKPPAGCNYGTMQVIGSDSSAARFVTQLFIERIGGKMAFRGRNDTGAAWQPWYEVYTTGNKPTAAALNVLPATGNNRYLGKLLVSDLTGAFVGTPTITLAIGDTDTGFKAVSDGQTEYWSNNVKRYNMHDVFHKNDDIFWTGDQDYRGIYWGSEYKDGAAHDGAWGYIRQGTTVGQLEIGSDEYINIYETDGRTLAAQFNTNNKTLDVKGHILEAGVKLSDKYVQQTTGYTVFKPKGGEKVGNPPTTNGAIKIRLPLAAKDRNTMLTIRGVVFEYSTQKSFEFCISGYTYASGDSWVNCSAYMTGCNQEYPVRFCHSGTESWIVIGNHTETWSYPQVHITDVTTGYSSHDASGWDDDWVISFDTAAATNVKQTITMGRQYTTQFKPTAADVGALTQAAADSRYLRSTAKAADSNLIDGYDISQLMRRLDNTNDYKTTANIMTMQQFANARPAGLASSAYPYGALLTFNDSSSRLRFYAPHNESGKSTLYVSSGWNTDIKSFAKVYTTEFKPTAADVGAISQATADSRYINNGQGSANLTHLNATGTGNDYHTGGVELIGNGTANTVYPNLGFHQPGVYASSLQLRAGGDFRFYTQGGSTYANVTANRFNGQIYRNNGGGSWVSQKSGGAVAVDGGTVSNHAYAAVLRQTHSAHTYTIGGLGHNYFGFFGYNNSRTENGTDFYAYLKPDNTWVCNKLYVASAANFHGNQITVRGGSPTILLQDTDSKSAFLHTNNSHFYILRSSGNDGTGWDSGPNGRHPMIVSLDTGNVTFSGDVTAFSDRRLKQDIQPIGNALSKVEQLNGVTYQWIDHADDASYKAGLIAQDVEQVLPEACYESEDGHKLVGYNGVIGLLVEAIKELKQEVLELRGA